MTATAPPAWHVRATVGAVGLGGGTREPATTTTHARGGGPERRWCVALAVIRVMLYPSQGAGHYSNTGARAGGLATDPFCLSRLGRKPVSRSHHRQLIGLPRNPGECENFQALFFNPTTLTLGIFSGVSHLLHIAL
jgi:hypothetical protein